MPAIAVDDILVLPRIRRPLAPVGQFRRVTRVVTAGHFLEGAGFPVRRPFPGALALSTTDPFLLLDHLGAIEYGPGEAKGAPWHPHRGFETVTYILDGELSHHDSNGGGGMITDGGTQWMTAGAGILHDEMPSERLLRSGGVFHGVQLWVNLPAAMKMNPPRYQDIHGQSLRLLSSDDGGALVRIIAGELDGHEGPGVTYTPITYLHATLSPGAQLALPWNADFSAMVYVLGGAGTVGPERRPIAEGQLALLAKSVRVSDGDSASRNAGEGRGVGNGIVVPPGDDDGVMLQAAESFEGTATAMDVLILGGQPIKEPIFHYGPFVMNTKAEIITAIEDFNAGRLGTIPAQNLDAHNTGGNVDV